jgi:hypothetical protein
MRAGDEIGLTPKQVVIACHYASHGQIYCVNFADVFKKVGRFILR